MTKCFRCDSYYTVFQKIFKDSPEAKRVIKSLLHEWLVDANGKDIFHGAFSYIKWDGDIDIDHIYSDLLQKYLIPRWYEQISM